MSSLSANDFKLAISDTAFQTKLRKAIDVLDSAGVFTYLRALSDKKLALKLDITPDLNGLVVSSAKHAGYSEALDNLVDIIEYAKASTKVFERKSSYGVKEEDVK